jgi:hypothetical protein
MSKKPGHRPQTFRISGMHFCKSTHTVYRSPEMRGLTSSGSSSVPSSLNSTNFLFRCATARAIDPQRPVRPVLLPRLHWPENNAALSARVNRRRVEMKCIFLITFLAAGILLASAQIKPPSAPPPVPLPPSAGCNNGRGCTAIGGAAFRPYSSLSRARALY